MLWIPLLSWHNLIIEPKYWSGVIIVALIQGSSILLISVGSGRLDGYFHNNINLWDIAAGILIVKEAGGITNDISKFNDNNINIRAASSGIFEKMMEKLGNF